MSFTSLKYIGSLLIPRLINQIMIDCVKWESQLHFWMTCNFLAGHCWGDWDENWFPRAFLLCQLPKKIQLRRCCQRVRIGKRKLWHYRWDVTSKKNLWYVSLLGETGEGLSRLLCLQQSLTKGSSPRHNIQSFKSNHLLSASLDSEMTDDSKDTAASKSENGKVTNGASKWSYQSHYQ